MARDGPKFMVHLVLKVAVGPGSLRWVFLGEGWAPLAQAFRTHLAKARWPKNDRPPYAKLAPGPQSLRTK